MTLPDAHCLLEFLASSFPPTGLFEALSVPSLYALSSQWAPKSERSMFISLKDVGSFLGMAAALPLTGWLADQYGWRSAFYVFGAFGIVWGVAWWSLSASTPEDHPSIDESEALYIVAHRMDLSLRQQRKLSAGNLAVPWRKILTHPVLWGLTIAHTCHNWVQYTLITWLPAYLNQVLHFDVKKSGVVAVLPFLASFLFSYIAGVLAVHAISTWGISVATTRKMAMFVSEILPAAALILVGYISVDNKTAVVALLTAAEGLAGFGCVGYGASFLDVSPQFAAVILAVSNTVATIPGFVAPILIGDLVNPPHNDVTHWRLVFFIAACFGITSFVSFACSARGEPLPELLE
jgi:sugar phosphate permease